MDHLLERVRKNRIQVQKLDQAHLQKLEPNIIGLGGLFIRDTGIVDFKRITRKMAQLFQEAGGKVKMNARVQGMSEQEDCVYLTTSRGEIKTRYVIACAGLMADRLVNMVGLRPDFQIIPFRGEYFKLPSSKQNIITHLIYPIPDPDFPFLGIHLTRMIDGSVTVGPNAVLGLKREGYRRGEIDWTDLREMIRFKGFWHVLQKNLFSGIWELKNSILRREYLKQVRKYYPGIQLTDLKPHPTGVRAQAVSSNGTLIHDFLFMKTKRTFHVCNAPSPAATSAIPIGKHIVDQVAVWR
jgi:L-2-hydroxyglutarate oxidase